MIECGDYEGVHATTKDASRILQLENIVKTIGEKVIIKDLSLTCFQDEVFVLIGKNGAGKTSLLESIAGNHEGLAGTMHAHGIDI